MTGFRFLKTFFLKMRRMMWNQQFATFLIFLFLAATFWLMTALDEITEHNFTVRLVVKNVPNNVIITNNIPTTIEVKLKDKGSVLLAYRYKEELPPVEIDFARHIGLRGNLSISTLDLLRPMVQKLRGNTSIVSVNKETISIEYSYGESKRIPVRFLGKMSKGSEYVIADFLPHPDSVTVYATPAVLDTITSAYIGGTYSRTQHDTLYLQHHLENLPQAKFVPSSLSFQLSFDRLVEKTAIVPIRWVNFPASKALRTFPAKVNVRFRIGMNSYRQVTADDFAIVVNYEEVLARKDNRLRLYLRSLPKGVKSAELSPNEVEFVVEDLPETE